MKTITGITKKSKNYEVFFNGELLVVEPEVFLKYRLSLGKELELKTYKEFVKENEYTFFYKLGIIKLKRMLTRKEIKDFLISKGASEPIAKQVVQKYIERKYVDDFVYAKDYIAQKKYSDGPLVIEHKLREKGIDPAVIEDLLRQNDETEILLELMPKKMRSMSKKSKKQALQTVKGFFIRKGFHMEAVDTALKNALEYYTGNELSLIEKDYQKLVRRYQTKPDHHNMQYEIIQKLYAKGYKIEDIKKVVKS
jgi:regulatory protein